jgi:hypothetical protein
VLVRRARGQHARSSKGLRYMPRLTSDFSSDFRDYDTDEIVVVYRI